MKDKKISLSGHLAQFRTVLFGLLSITGLSFCFFLGFPFGNHNESYLWVAQLNRLGFVDVLSRGLEPVANFRPLGMATAWLGYKLSGGSIYPQQVLNYLGAALAWLILFSAIKEKKLFAWVSFLAGGVSFSGYIYLFHLHGVFYSPLLVFLAFLLASSISHQSMQNSWLVVISALAIVAALYHPFAIPIYVAFMIGHFLENLHRATRKHLVVVGLLPAASYGMMRIAVPGQGLVLTTKTMLGLLTSYKTVEVNLVLSMVFWFLSLVTIMSLGVSWHMRIALGTVITILSFVFVSLSWPIVVVWIIVSLLKSILIKKWSLAFVIVTTALLPAASATGSPTYSIFVVMTCSFVVPLGCPLIERDSVFHDAVALISIVLVITATVLLRNGTHLPVVSRLAAPILAEKEKTFQLEKIIAWMTSSDFEGDRLVLCEEAGNPATSDNAIERTHRPPTYQNYLDAYLNSLRTHQSKDVTDQLVVCFGGSRINNAKRVYSVAGNYSGEATVWKQTK